MTTQTNDTTATPRLWEQCVFMVSTFAIVSLFYFITLLIVQWSMDVHWLLGLPMAVGFVWVLTYGIRDLKSREARGFPVFQGIGIFLLNLAVAMISAAVFSLTLLRAGWASYAGLPESDPLFHFGAYYLWIFLDMIPGLAITETLWNQAPLAPQGFVAGLPVVAFRAFVLYGLLSALRTWWMGRRRAHDRPAA